jgi:hypothetical protein
MNGEGLPSHILLMTQTFNDVHRRGRGLFSNVHVSSGPGSVVVIATAYGLDGPGMESQWGRDFLHLCRPALKPSLPPVQWVRGLSWE